MPAFPVLYSFRRCPYAIRARLAIQYSGVYVSLREVVLRDKPQALIEASSKGTVPVLVLADDRVIDESLDIMDWALAQNDPDRWLGGNQEQQNLLINTNDHVFKPWLDQYKYPDRHPDYSQAYYRERCEGFLLQLEQRLAASPCLLGDKLTLADTAIIPFIRQFSLVDKPWFAQSPYGHIKRWLSGFLQGPLFNSVMEKYPQWVAGSSDEVIFPRMR